MKGKKEKKEFDQNIALHEVFLESVPTALIITLIGVRAGIIGSKKNILIITQLGIHLIIILQEELTIPVCIQFSSMMA